MISIGIHYGGPEHENSALTQVLERALAVAMSERKNSSTHGSEGWINPVFVVPGSISKPDFVGISKGHFSRKRKGLVLKVAVPDQLVTGDGLSQFVVTSLRECVVVASKHFTAKDMSFSTLDAERIIQKIEHKLATV